MTVRAITFDFWCTLFRDAEKDERQHLRIVELLDLRREIPPGDMEKRRFDELVGADRRRTRIARTIITTGLSKHQAIEKQRHRHLRLAVGLCRWGRFDGLGRPAGRGRRRRWLACRATAVRKAHREHQHETGQSE